MRQRVVVRVGFRAFGSFATAVVLVGLAAALGAQDPEPKPSCSIDLERAGQMSDVLSNALLIGLHQPESKVSAFLEGADERYDSGRSLLQAAAKYFAIEEGALTAQVERFRHCNCTHPPVPGRHPLPGSFQSDVFDAVDEPKVTVSAFANDVMLHVVLHEMAHGLIREFDLPVLGNEETMADAFATHYLTHHLPARAPSVLLARVRSWMIEAAEVPRAEWPVSGEHDNDARRAFHVAALAVAVDAEVYAEVAKAAGLSERDLQQAKDYGADVHRAWRRTLAPLWMPVGMTSREARVQCDATDPLFGQLRALGLVTEIESALCRFDWHSAVKVRFLPGGGGAAWSRSSRTITVHGSYLRRFVAQGLIVEGTTNPATAPR